MSTLKGIDISKWQGSVDFNKVKNDGIQFVILREGYRKEMDPKFREYVTGCKSAGLQIPAIYHFMYSLNVEDAKAEAYSAVSNILLAGLDNKTIVFADFEYDTIKDAAKKGVTLTKADCIAHTKAFCEEVKRLGYTPGIYTNIDFYKNYYDKSLLSQYVIWLADYNGAPNYDCVFHQYTSKGKVNGISGNVDMNYWYQKTTQTKGSIIYSRQKVVDLVTSWLGKKESDGSYKSIIDIYNSYTGTFPRGTKMQYGWAWCACTWSALAIKLGYTDIMPIEISCYYLIVAAKRMGIWVEQDSYVPKPGDAVLYDWDDNGTGDNTGNPDHIGTVVEVNGSVMVIVEGNYSNAVKKRTLSINGRYIRGFVCPHYDADGDKINNQVSGKSLETVAREVIAGTWSNGANRKTSLEASGYNYDEVQKVVNTILNGGSTSNVQQQVTTNNTKTITASDYATHKDGSISGTYKATADLYIRTGAGTNKKALVCMPKGTEVQCYGYYSVVGDIKWLYIQTTIDGVKYIGFSSSKYLNK